MSRLEIMFVDVAGEMPRDVELVFDERSVDDELCLCIRDLTGPPRIDLLTKRIEIALNSIDTDRERIHDREVLRVLREYRCKHALDNVANLERQLTQVKPGNVSGHAILDQPVMGAFENCS